MSAVFKELSDINSEDEFKMRAGIFGHCSWVFEIVSSFFAALFLYVSVIEPKVSTSTESNLVSQNLLISSSESLSFTLFRLKIQRSSLSSILGFTSIS